MASASITISLDDESKDLIRQLIHAVKALRDAPADTSFGDPAAPGGSYPPKRLVEPSIAAIVHRGETLYSAEDSRRMGVEALKAVGDRYIEQHGTPVVKDDDYLLPTEHHEGEDTE